MGYGDMTDRLNNPTGADVGLGEFAPAPVDADFLRHVVKSTTSYSEGWRGVAARLLWVEAMLAQTTSRSDSPDPAEQGREEQHDGDLLPSPPQLSIAEMLADLQPRVARYNADTNASPLEAIDLLSDVGILLDALVKS